MSNESTLPTVPINIGGSGKSGAESAIDEVVGVVLLSEIVEAVVVGVVEAVVGGAIDIGRGIEREVDPLLHQSLFLTK